MKKLVILVLASVITSCTININTGKSKEEKETNCNSLPEDFDSFAYVAGDGDSEYPYTYSIVFLIHPDTNEHLFSIVNSSGLTVEGSFNIVTKNGECFMELVPSQWNPQAPVTSKFEFTSEGLILDWPWWANNRLQSNTITLKKE